MDHFREHGVGYQFDENSANFIRAEAKIVMVILRLAWGAFLCLFSLLLCLGGTGMIAAEVWLQEAGMDKSRGGIGIAMGISQIVLGLAGSIVGIRFLCRAISASRPK